MDRWTPLGSIDRVQDQLRAYVDAGVSELALIPLGAGPNDFAAQDGSEVGEVIVRSVTSGYAYVKQPAEQDARFHAGWLYIGDLATAGLLGTP